MWLSSPGWEINAADESTCRCRQQTLVLHTSRRAELHRVAVASSTQRPCTLMHRSPVPPLAPHGAKNLQLVPLPPCSALSPVGSISSGTTCRCRQQTPILRTSWSAEVRRVAITHATQRSTCTSTIAVCLDAEVASSVTGPAGGNTPSVCPLPAASCLGKKPFLDPRADDIAGKPLSSASPGARSFAVLRSPMPRKGQLAHPCG